MTVTLFLVAAFVVGTQALKAYFMVDVLIPDLEAILKYHAKSNNTNSSYIDWPNSITFQVIRVDDQNLKLVGDFGYRKLFTDSYNGLYYGNKEFHFKTETGDMTPVKTERIVSYKQSLDLVKAAPYISIKYFSLKEMQRSIRLYYQANELHFNELLYENPATFLYMPPESEGHVMEYFCMSNYRFKKNADSVLQVLIGYTFGKTFFFGFNVQAEGLVFDQKTRTLGVLKNLDFPSNFMDNVVGVRMATTGYKAQALKSGQKITNIKDFPEGSGNPKKHVVADYEFLKKVKVVEPRLRYRNARLPNYRLLNEGRFQVNGHIFMKKVNYLSNGTIDTNCPLLIKIEDESVHIKFKGEDVSKLCTDEIELSLCKD